MGVRSEEPRSGDGNGWTWDPSLYAGSADYYARGRVAYPPQLAEALVGALGLDGSGALLDVGCGPGSLTLLLAPWFAEAIGVDPDPGMLAEAARLATEQHVRTVSWRQLRAEQLPAGLPRPRLVTFAQSFHWMDRPRVAAIARGMLTPGGAVVHVGATTHEGIDDPDQQLPHPRPPRRDIARLVQRYLGPHRRAGRGVLASEASGGNRTPSPPGASYNQQREDDIFRAAEFVGPQRVEVPGRVVQRTVDEVAASVYSLSSSAPHLFDNRFAEFDRDLRQLLTGAGADGVFSEQMRSIGLTIWR